MATEIRMPEFAADMTEADLLSWLVKPGDQVEAGELIAEIETEKSTVEFESPVSGRLLEIRVPEGTNGVQVGTVLALVEESDATPGPQTMDAEGTIQFVARSADHYRLETKSTVPGFAVISEIWHPGWRATLDGEAIPLFRTNITQMGASIPSGTHQLDLHFRPLYWTTAKAITAGGLAALLTVGWMSFRKSGAEQNEVESAH